MQLVIAIESPTGDDEDYGVCVPDLVGCFSSGSTLEEAKANAVESIAFHIESLAEEGITAFAPDFVPSTIEQLQYNLDYAGIDLYTIDIDLTQTD